MILVERANASVLTSALPGSAAAARDANALQDRAPADDALPTTVQIVM